MQYVCDALHGRTWFRIDTEAEAEEESRLMRHSVERYFKREQARARASYQPGQGIERDVGLKGHLERETAIFVTLRADDGTGLATAMLPRRAKPDRNFRIILVGPGNTDPYVEHGDAIRMLGRHYGLQLERETCYPYARE